MTQNSETPTLTEVMREFVAEGLGGTHTSEVGRVASYDADTQTATVQPVVRGRFVDSDTGESEYELPPPIPNVPVAFPQGGGQSITWPLDKGDFVTLVYAERSLDEWQATGGDDNTPADTRRHDRTDAIAVPSLRSPADPLPANAHDPNAMVVVIPDGEHMVIGDANVDTYLARADRVEDEIDAVRTALEDLRTKFYNLHVHIDPLTGTTGPPNPATQDLNLNPPVGSVASDKVKGQ